ncbi:hypothetical protein SKAU_G00370810 [Synaphobranchus kaupii]|uniref:Uncharacterized protein n=1 Tax=Synaphobranchus kaupii TaxID=118154 RepID=A0A9Q1IEZ2_SYNKA|nr:hypothetical protein SKAU_G00370810 [Synaphobranchus kaupii]
MKWAAPHKNAISQMQWRKDVNALPYCSERIISHILCCHYSTHPAHGKLLRKPAFPSFVPCVGPDCVRDACGMPVGCLSPGFKANERIM